MSAELMKSKFVHPAVVHRPSVALIISEPIAWISFVHRPSVALIISEPIAWISFKFLFLLSLGHMPRLF